MFKFDKRSKYVLQLYYKVKFELRSMLSIRLNKDLEKSLQDTSDLLNISKSTLIKEAIKEYLIDKSDYLDALKILNNDKKQYSLEEVITEFKDEL